MNATSNFTAALLAGLAVLAVQPDARAQTVGTMTSEKATITKNGAGRITKGAPIARGDQLAANASGSGMIVFDDESSARLGPNARLVIDDVVYNPSRKSGTIRRRPTAGAARIFGGQISKRGSSDVRTPHIVLGVRGGIVDIFVQGGQTIATLCAGLMKCTSGGRTRTITNPGVSCIGTGSSLEVAKLAGSGRNFVDPGTGSGTSSGGGNTQFCASAAGMNSPMCRTRDTGLPGPGRTPPGSKAPGTPGGTTGYNQGGYEGGYGCPGDPTGVDC